MEKLGIPTAGFVVSENKQNTKEAALSFLKEDKGVVLKASGLAAGKGVFVCHSEDQIHEALERLYGSSMAHAAKKVVIERCLVGKESSYFLFLGYGTPISLGSAVDYKRLKDDNQGPNTGGMGCYAPVPWIPEGGEEQIDRLIVQPLVEYFNQENLIYTGCLYVGVMWTESGPKVVEFNIRLGDPEAQVLAVQDQRDWLELMLQKTGLLKESSKVEELDKAVSKPNQGQDQQKSVCVVLASQGYPYDAVDEGVLLKPEGLDFSHSNNKGMVFGASVQRSKQGVLTTGPGRVLSVVAAAESFSSARQKVYAQIEKLTDKWHGCQYRKDIALKIGEVKS